jgi:hypothetical protein
MNGYKDLAESYSQFSRGALEIITSTIQEGHSIQENQDRI